MPSILSTNMASLYAQRSLATAQADVATSVQRLSSGKRINSAKDDAAGLGISEGIAGIRNISDQSIRNLQNAGSLVQTAEGALEVVNQILQRALTLTTQKNDATLNSDQQGSIDGEINSLLDEIGRIRERTKFNSDETIFGASYSFGSGLGVTTSFTIPELTIPALGLNGQTRTVSVDSVDLALVANGNITLPSPVQFSGITRDIAQLGSITLPSPVQFSGATLDRAAISTVAASYSTPIVDFSKSGIALSSNKFNIPNNNFTDGDEVIYRKGSGVRIDPFIDGQRYFVKNVDGDTFQLSGTFNGPVIGFTALGSSTDADFLKVAASPVDISSVGVNATTTTTLQISQNWNDGDKVFFAIGAASPGATGGLEDGNVYTVSNATPNSVTLLDYSGQPVAFSFSDNLQGSTLQYLGANPSVRVVSNSEVKSPYHGFSGGEKVFYSGPNQGGLIQNTVYYVSTLNPATRSSTDQRDYFRLAPTSPDAIDRTNLITIPNASPNNNFYWAPPNATPEGSFQSNPVLPANSLVMNDTGFQPDDLVFYHQGSDAIGGLIDGDLYYVVTANNNTIQLSSTYRGPVNSLGSFSDLTGASVQKVSSQLVFNSGSPNTVILGDTIYAEGHGFEDGDIIFYHENASNPIDGLTDNTPYHVINPTNDLNTFQLSGTLGGGAIPFSSLGGPNQVFTPNTNRLTTPSIHSLSDGDRVYYSSTGDSIPELTNGNLYYVRSPIGDTFALSEDATGSVISFTGSGSGNQTFSRLSDVIESTGHGFEDGQRVYYNSANGTSIPELTNGISYFVRNRNNDAFQLSETESGPIIGFTGVGNSNQTFSLDTDYIDASGNTFSNGDTVIYNSNGGSAINPLTAGGSYIVRDVSGSKFRLAEIGGSIIDISSMGTDPASFTSVPSSDVIESIGHEFSNGQRVIYTSNGPSSIPELTNGDPYYVRNRTNSTFQLSETENGPIISFTGAGNGPQSFTLNTDIINSDGHGFSTGDEVIYSADGGAVIGGLSEGGRYFIIRNDDNSFELSATNGGSAINLTSTGDGVFTHQSAAISTSSISNAITINSSNRAELGALSNSISYAIDNLQTLSSNLSDAYSRIVDTDYASETSNLTRSKILQQASAAMLAQANQMPNVILFLLK
jgi:flagellin-like hook-associated protein FlgL